MTSFWCAKHNSGREPYSFVGVPGENPVWHRMLHASVMHVMMATGYVRIGHL